MKKTILVLANSIKKGGRCVAGIEIVGVENGSIQFGKFIRPIDATQPEGTLERATTTIDNYVVHPLDIVEIEFKNHADDPNHPEDWNIYRGSNWKLIGKCPEDALNSMPHNAIDKWGKNKSVTPGSSGFTLQLIKTPKPYTVRVFWKQGYYNPELKCELELDHLRLPITDPAFPLKHRFNELAFDEEKEFQIATGSFLLLSLTPPFTNKYDYTAQYKVVASIIENDA